MLLGRYYVTAHAIEQYDDRVHIKNKKNILKCIRYDLRVMNIKRIIYDKDDIYVFTKGYKEFIFVKDNKKLLCLKTIIKRNKEDTEKTILKRQKQIEEYVAN